MITLKGIHKKSGIVMAAGAVVNVIQGINAVAPVILEKGINSLKRNMHPRDYPEVIIACDSLAVGMSSKLPGLTVVGIAAESDLDISGMEPEVPCVIGLSNLLKSIPNGEIVIMDADEGNLFIDPDTDTIINYQKKLHQYEPLNIYQIDNMVSPAVTRLGKVIFVYAIIRNDDDLEKAASQSPEGYIIIGDASKIGYERILKIAAGRQTWFLMQKPNQELFNAVQKLAAPGQVTAFFDEDSFDKGLVEITLALANSKLYEPGGTDIPWVSIGVLLTSEKLMEMYDVSHIVMDIGSQTVELDEILKIAHILRGDAIDRVVTLLGNNFNALNQAIQGGIKCIAVDADSIRRAKIAISELD